MSFSLSSDSNRTLVGAITCFETMTDHVSLCVRDQRLSVRSVDHDDTTLVGLQLQVQVHPSVGVEDLSCRPFSAACSAVMRTLQTMSGALSVSIGVSGWTLTDTIGRTQTWGHQSRLPPIIMDPIYTADPGRLTLLSSDLLLYLQHIAICESYVQFSSAGPGDLQLTATGEFLSICVRHTTPQATPVTTVDVPGIESTVSVVVKYVRSILPLLQRATELTVTLNTSMGLLIEYMLDGANGFILLKDQVHV